MVRTSDPSRRGSPATVSMASADHCSKAAPGEDLVAETSSGRSKSALSLIVSVRFPFRRRDLGLVGVEGLPCVERPPATGKWLFRREGVPNLPQNPPEPRGRAV